MLQSVLSWFWKQLPSVAPVQSTSERSLAARPAGATCDIVFTLSFFSPPARILHTSSLAPFSLHMLSAGIGELIFTQCLYIFLFPMLKIQCNSVHRTRSWILWCHEQDLQCLYFTEHPIAADTHQARNGVSGAEACAMCIQCAVLKPEHSMCSAKA